MLIGVIAGGLATLFGRAETDLLQFNPEIFFFILLPPIIFDAGYTLKRKNFFRNFGSILTFAVLGTLVSTIVIGYGLYGIAKTGIIPLNSSTPLECLVFGALISATDPVATLSILGSKQIDAPPLLHSLVFGESVLNDAVAIVLYKTFEGFLDEDFTHTSIFLVIVRFFGVSIGSIGIGVALALLLSFTTKRVNFSATEGAHYQFTLIILFAYSSYFLAEIIGLSGIMSLFFCAVCLAHYNYYNICEHSQMASTLAFKSLSQLCETFVFSYLGITAGLSFSTSSNLSWSPTLIVFTILWCLISRAAHIFPFCAILNLGRKNKIPFPMQIALWFAGLRGAIAFALSLQVPTENRQVIITTTLFLVMFSTIFMGGLTEPLISRLKLRASDMAPQNGSTGAEGGVDAEAESEHTNEPEQPRTGFAKLWFHLDNNFVKPYFGGQTRGLISVDASRTDPLADSLPVPLVGSNALEDKSYMELLSAPDNRSHGLGDSRYLLS
eukprot:TRINITY_DN2672_c0_g1_i9.p1 TRINITY_DN2672_c0_g1~~TRINITY_DN2672_c0_g1_i9.p1  ORF type:complete len:496 (+),score=109.12 TRINITY_DN2672_c0_g1_i9:178-1665(+)